MKILCLHGKGTSGAIFKSQTAALRARLTDLPIEWDFLDGFHPSDPAAGIDLFYAPPYYAWYRDDTPTEIETCRQHLHDHISTHGPYAAVMSFSQGAAVACAYALLHLAQHPPAPLPFHAAIFICAGAPLAIMQQVGYEIAPQVWEQDRVSRQALAAQADAAAILLKGSQRWSAGVGVAVEEEEQAIRKAIVPPAQKVKIGVPTVHVYGNRDPRFAAGIQLSQACEEGSRKMFDHGGGHEIPRTERVTSGIAGLVRWALKEGGVV
ncbi:putative EF-hand calcium-binding domain protein [Aspergillus saccharolyticus JOP 1030-1]|uniref:Putative EF-hand calcium-binding domain protein n=1 Tax=Aspergillus saccharolyticus JOP 1030-1 TaxID=1450539 RepID=A0A318Z1U3_9EURO|nr:putative EF-hand calcium-binding domain protein [Aspergillus saccharolyticus JOP 1030-1]PYH41261.1 putative EF-hand calcium-binding domain protein [Aspergillus saccharolyticus JOP 1030-1]